MAKPILTNPSYYDIEKGCAILVADILAQQLHIDIIVGLSRGGLLPAVIMSHLLNKPMMPVSYSSTSGHGDDRNHLNQLPNIYGQVHSGHGTLPPLPNLLIVDDICDSGKTFQEVEAHYMNEGHVVTTAALYYKQIERPPHFPGFIWQTIPVDAPWIIFPWET